MPKKLTRTETVEKMQNIYFYLDLAEKIALVRRGDKIKLRATTRTKSLFLDKIEINTYIQYIVKEDKKTYIR